MRHLSLLTFLSLTLGTAIADNGVEHIVVRGYRSGFGHDATSAAEGHIGFQQLQFMPWQRVGEMLETIPGLIVSQHSGEGKANQFYLRGFNLDHGSDFATSVNGLPINFRSHAHGQGYTDLNFLMPELIGAVDFRKGSYRGSDGDFSSAGSANIIYGYLPDTAVYLNVGQENYSRLFAGNHWHDDDSSFIAAAAIERDDGPWTLAQDLNKTQAYFAWSKQNADDSVMIEAMHYRNAWNSSDQIPERAVRAGAMSRFDTVDQSDGGNSARDSLAWRWQRSGEQQQYSAQLYALRYQLDLFSNFTYFLNDPLHGDQFEQADQRQVYGAQWQANASGEQWRWQWGVNWQRDAIADLGLYLTQQRVRLQTQRHDQVNADSLSLYGEFEWQLNLKWRVLAALHQQFYRADVESDRVENSGQAQQSLLSPRLSTIYQLDNNQQFFFNRGRGFHSNDARGATTTVDPVDGISALSPVDLLVASDATDIGYSARYKRWQWSLDAFQLDIDSELIFIGDGGSTEATRPSRRRGIEWAGFWQLSAATLLDWSWSRASARFRDNDAEGNFIAGAPQQISALGLSYNNRDFFVAARWRYFGARALNSDNSQRSGSTALWNINAGWQINSRWQLSASCLNVLNREQDGIRYFYVSQLASESAPQADQHFHPAEPRSLRLSIQANW